MRSTLLFWAGISVLSVAGAIVAAEPETATAAGWPQYRGPTRDGIAPAGPKLASSFGDGGPKLLWKTNYGQAMMVGQNGGSCSPIVSGGKVILYANPRPLTPKKLITADYLAKWGWNADVPDDLARKLEDERRKNEYAKDVYGKEAKPQAMEAFITAFTSRLDPAVAEKFKATIDKRLRFAWTEGWDWDTLAAMYKNINTEFKTRTEFEQLYRTAPMHHNYTLGGEVETFLKQLEEKSFDIVICLNAETGKELWKQEYPGLPGRSATMNSWPASSTPAIVGEKIYLLGSAAVYCLSLATGEQIWKSNPLTRCENSSPLVVNGKVAVVLETGLTCFDASTGAELWKNREMGGRYDWGSAVCAWTHAGITYLISAGGKCVDLETGKTLWSAVGVTRSCVLPTISGDTAIFFGEKLQAFNLSPEKAEQIWSVPGRSADRVSAPIIYQDNVYTSASGTRCLDLKTGEQRWEDKTRKTMFCMPAFADGKIIAAADDSAEHGHDTYWPIVFCFNANPAKFEAIWQLPVSAALAYCSSPALVNGRMYVHQLDGIACYDLRESGK